MLQHLPCDLSFADEDDVLLFWSGATYKTREGRFIGRGLRDCHPERSLATLEEILREFKAGRRDVAEGWSGEKGRFVHTRCTAVRDAEGAYRGILEVNVDATALRQSTGDQVLPGW